MPKELCWSTPTTPRASTLPFSSTLILRKPVLLLRPCRLILPFCLGCRPRTLQFALWAFPHFNLSALGPVPRSRITPSLTCPSCQLPPPTPPSWLMCQPKFYNLILLRYCLAQMILPDGTTLRPLQGAPALRHPCPPGAIALRLPQGAPPLRHPCPLSVITKIPRPHLMVLR